MGRGEYSSYRSDQGSNQRPSATDPLLWRSLCDVVNCRWFEDLVDGRVMSPSYGSTSCRGSFTLWCPLAVTSWVSGRWTLIALSSSSAEMPSDLSHPRWTSCPGSSWQRCLVESRSLLSASWWRPAGSGAGCWGSRPRGSWPWPWWFSAWSDASSRDEPSSFHWQRTDRHTHTRVVWIRSSI